MIDHQLIRYKLAEMARAIESTQDMVERVAFQFASGVPASQLGGACALLKVQVSKTFEYCAREASLPPHAQLITDSLAPLAQFTRPCVAARTVRPGTPRARAAPVGHTPRTTTS